MTRLTLLLIIKIVFTILTVVAPFLLLPPDRVAEMTGAAAPSPSLYRLYGIAMIAILIGYAFAIPVAQRGNLPLGALIMGIISNGGAALILFAYGAQGMTLFLAYVFGVIAALLFGSILGPKAALKTLSGRELQTTHSVADASHRT